MVFSHPRLVLWVWHQVPCVIVLFRLFYHDFSGRAVRHSDDMEPLGIGRDYAACEIVMPYGDKTVIDADSVDTRGGAFKFD